MAPMDEDRHFILQGVAEGFRVTNINVSTPPSYQRNHPSVTNCKNVHKVQAQIQEEINNGRYVVCAVRPHIISALGALPKPNSKEIRLIHDASRPHGTALNDFAISDKYTCSTVEAAAAMVKKNGYMGKVDLSSAYRSVRIHPSDYAYAGLQWTYPGHNRPTYMHDTRLMFGARLSASTFNRLTQAVVRIMKTRGRGANVLVYCDDFFITHERKEECRKIMNELMGVLRELGFAINYNKLVAPSTKITFLGVEINTVAHTLALPREKMAELIAEGRRAGARASMTKRELQSICGKLSWAAQVIYGGRTHLRRIIDATTKLARPHHRTRLTQEIRRDIQWWTEVAATHNGCTKILCNEPITPVCIDACLQGGGGYHAGQWYSVAYNQWPGTDQLSINYKEVLALVPACHIWAPLWENKRVYIYSDNQAAVAIINRGAAKEKTVMKYLREIYQSSVTHNYKLKAIYYPGKLNVVADAASRLVLPGGYQRLQAALSGAFINTPTVQRAINQQHVRHEHSRARQDSSEPPTAGVCEEHAQGVRHTPQNVSVLLQHDTSRASPCIDNVDMQIHSIPHTQTQIQLGAAIPQYHQDNAQRGRSRKPHGGRLLYHAHTAWSAAPDGRRTEQEETDYTSNITRNIEEPEYENTNTRSGVGSGTTHVLRTPATIKRHRHNSDGFQPGNPPATRRRQIQSTRSGAHNTLVQDQSIQKPATDHTVSEGATAPTLPNPSSVQCIQPHARCATRRPSTSNRATRAPRRPTSKQGAHRTTVLGNNKTGDDRQRHRPRGIRHPQFQEGRKLFPLQQRHPPTQYQGIGRLGIKRIHRVCDSRHNGPGAHNRSDGSGTPKSVNEAPARTTPTAQRIMGQQWRKQKGGVAGGPAHQSKTHATPSGDAARHSEL